MKDLGQKSLYNLERTLPTQYQYLINWNPEFFEG